MWVIVTGDPIAGFEYFGIFEEEPDAVEWADRHLEDRDWWIALVNEYRERDRERGRTDG